MNTRMFLYGEYTFEQEQAWKKRRDEIMQDHKKTEERRYE